MINNLKAQVIKLSVSALVCTLALIGCGPSGGGYNGNAYNPNTVAALPDGNVCGQGLPSGVFTTYQGYGFRPYEAQAPWFHGAGGRDFRGRGDGRGDRRGRADYELGGGCGAQYQPLCDQNGGGLTCAPVSLLQGQNLALYGVTNQGSFGYTGVGSIGSSPYQNQVGLTCTLGNPASCGGYGICSPINSISAFGVCTQ